MPYEGKLSLYNDDQEWSGHPRKEGIKRKTVFLTQALPPSSVHTSMTEKTKSLVVHLLLLEYIYPKVSFNSNSSSSMLPRKVTEILTNHLYHLAVDSTIQSCFTS